MQLKSDEAGRNALQDVILDYYKAQGRSAILYKETSIGLDRWLYMSFLIDRSRVIRYAIGNDANSQSDRWVGGIELGIGPDFFGPAMFWSFEHLELFRQGADSVSVVHNLRLLDQFWGLSHDKVSDDGR